MPGRPIVVGLAALPFLRRTRPDVFVTPAWLGQTFRKALARGLRSLMAPVVILGGIYARRPRPPRPQPSPSSTPSAGWAIHREPRLAIATLPTKTTSWMAARVLIIMFHGRRLRAPARSRPHPDRIVESILGVTADVTVISMFVIAIPPSACSWRPWRSPCWPRGSAADSLLPWAWD
ncbi:MAG: hypothetical protein V8Q84_10835, partial [Bilophila sp.]